MKKIFAAVAIVALFASCKKDYTCTCFAGTILETTVTYDGLSKSDADAQETACKAATCTWAEK
jgi:hypothetical protein